ncbi:MAG: PorP/SprF family type IX secretion system membrane protein [Bacteroidota bacterium]
MSNTYTQLTKVFFFGIIAQTIGLSLYGQQIPVFTQYVYEPSWYIPAVAGLSPQTKAFVGHRSQWLGLESAPSSQLIGFSGQRINQGALAVGGFFYHDQAHLFRQLNAKVNFAYHLFPSSSLHQLSLGMSLGFHHQRINLDGPLELAEEGDPLVLGGGYQQTSPDAGVGLFYQYKQEQSRLYLGLSSSHLPKAFALDDGLQYVLRTHLLATIGAQFPLNDQVSLEPILLWKGLVGEQALGGGGVDLGLRVYLLDNQLWAGAGFRPQGGGFHGILGLVLEKVHFSALLEHHAWLGNSLEFGLQIPLAGISLPKEKPASPKTPKQIVRPKKEASATIAKNNSSKRQAYWENSQALIQQLRQMNPQAENVSIESFPGRKQVRLVYQFASEEEAYLPRKIPAVDEMLTHISSTIQDILDESKRPHLNKVESITITSLMQDDVEIMEAPSYIQYNGEWGSRLNKPYLVDGETVVESISQGKITRREQAFLKIFSIQKALSAKLNLSERVFRFELKTEASEEYFQEIVIDVSLK